jgi:hypothetical protein
MVPAPAARIDVERRIAKMIVGQRTHLAGTAYSQHGDRRDDRITWRAPPRASCAWARMA